MTEFEDGSVRVYGSRRAYAIRRAQWVEACMKRHPAGSARSTAFVPAPLYTIEGDSEQHASR